MKDFVYDLYKCDSVPIEHLEKKINYLCNAKPEVLIIFVKNTNPKEKFIGIDKFRKIQCIYINEIKIKIRNQFNPKHSDGN